MSCRVLVSKQILAPEQFSHPLHPHQKLPRDRDRDPDCREFEDEVSSSDAADAHQAQMVKHKLTKLTGDLNREASAFDRMATGISRTIKVVVAGGGGAKINNNETVQTHFCQARQNKSSVFLP